MLDDPHTDEATLAGAEGAMQASLGAGHAADLARAHMAQGGARVRARLALDIARRHAAFLPCGAGAPLASLAGRVEPKIEEPAHAA